MSSHGRHHCRWPFWPIAPDVRAFWHDPLRAERFQNHYAHQHFWDHPQGSRALSASLFTFNHSTFRLRESRAASTRRRVSREQSEVDEARERREVEATEHKYKHDCRGPIKAKIRFQQIGSNRRLLTIFTRCGAECSRLRLPRLDYYTHDNRTLHAQPPQALSSYACAAIRAASTVRHEQASARPRVSAAPACFGRRVSTRPVAPSRRGRP